MSIAFDTLALARDLETAGFPSKQAQDTAAALSKIFDRQDVATKADLAALEVRIDMKLELLRRELTIRMGGMIVVATGVILAAIRLG